MGVPRNRADHRGLEFCTNESRCSRPGGHLGQTDSYGRLRHNERYIIRSPAFDPDMLAIPQFLDGVSIPLPCGRNWVLRKVCLCGRAAGCVVEGAQITGSGTWSKFTPPTGRIFCLTGTPVNASDTPFRMHPHDSGSSWLARPSMSDSYIPDSLPVYPGALISQESLV